MLKDENPIFQFRGPWGVPVQVAPSLLMLVAIFVLLGGSVETLFYDLAFAAILIGSIFLHELGHAWGCLIQGVPVRRIMLYGGGGFCEHAGATTRYEEELIVAMGPIVNLAIWAVASLVEPSISNPVLGWAVFWLAQLNLFLALFNLLPVMPLDGGKLFQLGAMRLLPDVTATRVAGAVGVLLSVLWIPGMVVVFLYFGFVLFFIPPLMLHLEMARAAR
jgi:Zn-dependent protease